MTTSTKRLTTDEVTADAVSVAGVDDFGPDTWQEGLTVLLDSVASEAQLSELGDAILRAQVRQFLVNRLRIRDWYRRCPEISDERIPLPVFSIGMVRTGTTALSFLLDQDPGNRSLLHWMAMQPCPPPKAAHLLDDARIAGTAQAMGLTGMEAKDRAAIELLPDGPAECLHLLSLDFRSGHFEGMFRVPTYHDWLFASDLRPAYEWHRAAVKLLQWRAPTRRWMFKYPSHMMALEALTTVYPEARFVVTHRDPASSIASVCSLVGHGSSAMNAYLDPLYLGRQWTSIVETQLQRMIAFRDTVGDDRFFDVHHHELVRAPMATLERLYDWLDTPLTQAAREAFQSRIASNPKGVYGVHHYEAQTYGINVAEVHERFRSYTERFGVSLEGES